MSTTRIAEIIDREHADILSDWISIQSRELSGRSVSSEQLTDPSRTFVALLREAALRAQSQDIMSPEWTRVREFLEEFGRQRAIQGYSPSEVATFVFSFKEPLFSRLRRTFAADPEGLADETWRATILIDKLGLYTTEVYQKGREQVIRRQQQEMLELSTPVVRLWQDILALPLIGTLDSARTQIVMQNLLEAIVNTGATVAIIDITGVPTVDTLVAQHLLRTVAAARLMGADCIISGIRPQIAQTIIHLGVDLTDVITKATLADAFQVALKQLGLTIGKAVAKA
jgi:rsbT co-antagonist protein RsbR